MPVDPRMFAPVNLGEILRNAEQIRGSQSDRAYREAQIQRQQAESEREAASRAALAQYLINAGQAGAPTTEAGAVPTLGSMIPDPSWEAAVRADPEQAMAARRLMRGDTPTPSALQRDYEFMESIQPGLGRQMLEGRADPIVQVDVTGDGIPDTTLRSAVMGRVRGQSQGETYPEGTVIENDAGERMIRQGGQWVPQGGQASQARAPFNPSAINANWTSGRRTPQGNAAVGGVPNSRHLTGDAADFTPRSGESMGQLAARLRRQFPSARVINEGDHVHVQQSGWNVPYHGRRGTAGMRGR